MGTDTSAGENQSVSLLLIDDDTSFLQVLSRILRDYPNQRFASSGADGFRLVREARPDLILLDIDMPELDGLEFCRQLKADPEFADVPVIFITSSRETPIAVAGFHVGANDYVTKPVNRHQLLTSVREVLER